MTVQSKLLGDPSVFITCKDFQHPWTDKCVNASAGILLSATPYCLRVYTIVYALSLLMRHRIPTLNDLKRTILGILQSTAFLTTNAFSFILYNCFLRHVFGGYYFATISFVPCFMAAFTAILVERPARRPLLTLYVANVATETLWNMAEARGWVRTLPYGQTIIFGLSISTLLYLFRLGWHKSKTKDAIFNIIRIFVGKNEEGPIKAVAPPPQATTPPTAADATEETPPTRRRIKYTTIAGLVQAYSAFLNAKHASCTHKCGCVRYAAWGGFRPFLGGVGLQVALKVVLNFSNIMQSRMKWRKHIFNGSTLKLGIFLGSFSLLYKSVACALRHSFGYDDARFAIPAGLISSLAFTQYPDNTVALYVMWKAMQILYNLGIDEGFLPRVPHFTLFLYSFFTAVLFHAGMLEAKTLRPSYYKFLQAISGERLSKFNFTQFDMFGKHSAQQARETIKALNIIDKSPLPKFPCAW